MVIPFDVSGSVKDANSSIYADQNILVVLAEYYDSGGTRTYIKQLLDFHYSQGFKVILVGLELEPDSELGEFLHIRGMSFVPYSQVISRRHSLSSKTDASRPKVWSPGYMCRERKSFREFLTHVGARGIVVSVGTPGLFAGALGSVRDNIYVLHTYPHGRRQRLFGRHMMKVFFKRSKAIVSVSRFEESQLRQLWNLPDADDRIWVIPNTTGPIQQRLSFPENRKFEVITASWVEPYKSPEIWLGVSELVSSRLGMENVRFTWLGEGSLLPKFRIEAEKTSQHVDVQFVGHQDDVESFYRQASVYLQLSSTENMSLSVIDALKFGLPAVVSNAGALPEIVEHDVNGKVVSVGSVEQAAEAIVQILSSKVAWERMSQAAQERYTSVFSTGEWTRKMIDLHISVFGTINDHD
jgi:glycosyltransferase involved in cell wall biosynthesis